METQEEVTVKSLLESGAHFGHQRHRWNPKMKPYIFEERNGIYIIDLAKTMHQIRKAKEVIEKTIDDHKTILFVGTKKQAKAILRDLAEECGEFYVCERWLGGMLTNLPTIRLSIKTLEEIEKQIASGGEGMTKKEMVLLNKKRDKLDTNLAGIRAMRKPPGLLIIVDPKKEHIAVAEAKKLGIPIMALVDTNCNPDPIDYVIACNDDALKSIKLILGDIMQTIINAKAKMNVEIKKEGMKALEKQKEIALTEEPPEVKEQTKEALEKEVKKSE